MQEKVPAKETVDLLLVKHWDDIVCGCLELEFFSSYAQNNNNKKPQLNMVATIFVQRMSKYQSEVKNELVWNCRPMYQCCQKVVGGCSVSSCSVPQSGFWHAKKKRKIKIKSQSNSELPLEWESITAVVTCYLIFLNCSSWFFIFT